MNSPIKHLKEAIAGSPFNIAPEHTDYLLNLRDSRNIEVQLIVDKPGFSIEVVLAQSLVRLPVPALEYLWACGHFLWVTTQEYSAAQIRGEAKLDFERNARLRAAATLFEWAKQNLKTPNRSPWPNELPSPQRFPEKHSDIHVANELFLAAVAWIIHHELAHVAFQHSGVGSVNQEKEADVEATSRVLCHLDVSDPRSTKRAFGIAVALLCIQSLEVGIPRPTVQTHPRAYQRIWDTFEKYVTGDGEGIKAFLVVGLSALFHNHGISPNVDGESFSEILSDMLLEISRLDASLS